MNKYKLYNLFIILLFFFSINTLIKIENNIKLFQLIFYILYNNYYNLIYLY